MLLYVYTLLTDYNVCPGHEKQSENSSAYLKHTENPGFLEDSEAYNHPGGVPANIGAFGLFCLCANYANVQACLGQFSVHRIYLVQHQLTIWEIWYYNPIFLWSEGCASVGLLRTCVTILFAITECTESTCSLNCHQPEFQPDWVCVGSWWAFKIAPHRLCREHVLSLAGAIIEVRDTPCSHSWSDGWFQGYFVQYPSTDESLYWEQRVTEEVNPIVESVENQSTANDEVSGHPSLRLPSVIETSFEKANNWYNFGLWLSVQKYTKIVVSVAWNMVRWLLVPCWA